MITNLIQNGKTLTIQELDVYQQSLLFAELSMIAYNDEKQATAQAKEIGFTEVHFFDYKGAQGYTFETATDLVVACRGTEPTEFSDLAADMNALPVRSQTMGRVHLGFKREADKIWAGIKAQIETSEKMTWFTGHSLGAAMTTLCAARCFYHAPHIIIGAIFTYGQWGGNIGFKVGSGGAADRLGYSMLFYSGLSTGATFGGDFVYYSSLSGSAGSSTLNTANELIRFKYNGNILIGTSTDAGFKLDVNGNTRIQSNLLVTNTITGSSALISGSGTQRLVVVGSGSAQPIFTVQGSQGELFSVTDSLSGSLFSVNDVSGLPILEVFSDSTTLVGSYLAPALNTTTRITTTNSGSFVIYSVPTASYDGIFVDYTARSGSNARAGVFTAIWSGSSVNYMDNSTTDFGNTTALSLVASISGSNMIVTGSVTAGS
jgi:hypothetical protein